MSKRLRQVFFPAHFSAAEMVLGGMALVLVIWLLWPESSEPKLDQRAAWQQHLQEAKAERAKKLAARRPVLQSEVVPEASSVVIDDDDKTLANTPGAVHQRRMLAKPSELADRIKTVRLPVELGASVTPTPEAAPNTAASETTVQQALGRVVDELTDEPETALEAAGGREVAVYSTEALDAGSALAAISAEPDHLVPADSFEIESSPIAHIRQRPRDDAPSWLKNAVTASLIDDRPVIAVVIDDLGLNRTNTKALNALPAPLTLAFLPYAGKVEAQTAAAHQAGHELMVHLPMEPFGSAWPGPDALITSLDQEAFIERLQKNLNKFKGFVGVNNHMGSRLTADRGRMDVVMRELRDRDVLFLDSKTSAGSVASEMASRNGVPNTIRDVFLDHVIDIGKIRNQMALVERIALRTGSAVAIGHPHAVTIEALRGWLPGLAARGFALAPISAVIARRACTDGLLITAETCGRYLHASQPDAPVTAEGG